MWSWVWGQQQASEAIKANDAAAKLTPSPAAEQKGMVANATETVALFNEVLRLVNDLVISPRFANVVDDVNKVTAMVNELNKNYAPGDSSTKDINTLRADGGIAGFSNIFGKSLSQLIAVVMQIGSIPEGASYYNPSTWITYSGNLLGQAQQLLKLLPILLESYEKLGVSSFLSRKDLTADAVKQLASEKLTSTLQTTLETFASYTATIEGLQNVPLVNNITLVSMQEVNDAIAKLYVFLDGMETKWGLEEGTLQKALEVKLQFPATSPLAKTTYNNMSIKDFCIAWQKDYQARMQKQGYIAQEDSYPYSVTVYHERLSLLEAMRKERDDAIPIHKAQAQQSIANDIEHLAVLADRRISALYEADGKGADSPEGQSRFACLELIRQVQALSNTDAMVILTKLSRKEDRPSDKEYWRTVDLLIAAYENGEKYHNNWLNERDQTIHQLEAKILRAVEADPTLAESNPFSKENRYDAIRENIKGAIADAKSIINDLYPAESAEEPEDHTNPVAQSQVLTKVGNYLQDMIDPELYERFFVNGEVTDERMPLQEIAMAINAAKNAIDYLNKFKTDVTFRTEAATTTLEAADAEITPGADILPGATMTPSQALAQTAENARGIIAASKALTNALQLLKSDPLTKQYFESLQLGYSKAKTKAVKLFTQNDEKTIDKIKKSQQSFLQKLADLSDKFKNNPDITVNDKVAMNRLVDNLKLIWGDVSPFVDAGNLSVNKIISIAYTRLSKLIELKEDLIATLGSLQKSSQENVLFLLEQLNISLKNTYLLFDKMENDLGLKDGALTHRIQFKAGERTASLVDIITEYEKIADRFDYPLAFNDRYPFPYAVLQQRQAMMDNTNPATEPTKHELAIKRVSLKEFELKEDKEDYLRLLRARAPKEHAITLIDRRIAELQSEMKSAFFFQRTLKSMKASLLTKLRDGLKTKSYDEMISSLKNHKGYMQYIHNILDGRTANLLQTIENGKLSPSEMERSIAEVIRALDKDLNKTFLFFTSRDTLRDRIAALEVLKASILKPNDPRVKLTTTQVELLKKYDSNTYAKVKAWEEIRVEHMKLASPEKVAEPAPAEPTTPPDTPRPTRR